MMDPGLLVVATSACLLGAATLLNGDAVPGAAIERPGSRAAFRTAGASENGDLFDGAAEDSRVRITGIKVTELDVPDRTPRQPRRVYEYADCDDLGSAVGVVPTLCALSVEQRREALNCSADQTPTSPRYVRSRPVGSSEANWTPWEWAGGFSCLDPEQPSTEQIVTILERDFTDLPIPPSPVRIQPDRDWTYVNLDTIVMTDPEPTTLTTTVLGVVVEVKVTPVSYRWDFGDGSATLVTTDPGKPYPHHTVAYAYPQTGEYPITLTTTWEGEFRIAGSNPWQAIAGTTTTTTTRAPLTLTERRARLVVEP